LSKEEEKGRELGEGKKELGTYHHCLADVDNEGGRIRSNTHPFVVFQDLKTSHKTLVHDGDHTGITMRIQTFNLVRMRTWRIMIHAKSGLALGSQMSLELIRIQFKTLRQKH
jgi:hypothetical protein